MKSVMPRFVYLLSVPVLFVLYIGLFISAIIAVVFGFLRAFGFEGIDMSLFPQTSLPAVLSIPVSFLTGFLLVMAALYIKRVMNLSLVRLRE